MRAALIEPIYGVSDKVLAMALSALLLGASYVEQLFTSLRNQAVKSAPDWRVFFTATSATGFCARSKCRCPLSHVTNNGVLMLRPYWRLSTC
jgi:uncharacterized membrane protein